MNILRWIFWATCFTLRAGLIVFGWAVPIHIGINTTRTKELNLWERYVENSWRNPTPYLRGVFKQPIPEVHPNPDALVRNDAWISNADRLMVSGPYIEYWELSKRDNSRFFKKHPYFEKRWGWKFVDGEETFYPTFQFHLSK